MTTYDDNVIASTDSRTTTTTFSYAALDNVIGEVQPVTAANPDLSDRTFTTVYDRGGRSGGRATEQRPPGGVTLVSSYDDLDHR